MTFIYVQTGSLQGPLTVDALFFSSGDLIFFFGKGTVRVLFSSWMEQGVSAAAADLDRGTV